MVTYPPTASFPIGSGIFMLGSFLLMKKSEAERLWLNVLVKVDGM